MLISTITFKVAYAIASAARFDICDFIKKAKPDTYLHFAHFDFYYSYPHYGTTWKDGKTCQYHRIETKCQYCHWQPDRNFAGVGNIYLLFKGPAQRMILLCPQHAKEYRNYSVKLVTLQLSLFN